MFNCSGMSCCSRRSRSWSYLVVREKQFCGAYVVRNLLPRVQMYVHTYPLYSVLKP